MHYIRLCYYGSSSLFSARRRRIWHGTEFRDSGCPKHQAHARIARPLSTKFAGMYELIVSSCLISSKSFNIDYCQNARIIDVNIQQEYAHKYESSRLSLTIYGMEIYKYYYIFVKWNNYTHWVSASFNVTNNFRYLNYCAEKGRFIRWHKVIE